MTTFETSQQSDLFPTELASMSSQAAFPAKTSALQESKQVLRASVVDYGQSAPVLLGSFSPDTPSLRTSQTCLMESGEIGLSEFSGTFPRSGMMRSGIVYQLVTLAPHIEGTEFGSLLTPSAQGWKAWTFRNPYALIRKNHADGNLQEQLMRLYQRMITPECEEQLMGFPISWTDLNA